MDFLVGRLDDSLEMLRLSLWLALSAGALKMSKLSLPLETLRTEAAAVSTGLKVLSRGANKSRVWGG